MNSGVLPHIPALRLQTDATVPIMSPHPAFYTGVGDLAQALVLAL